MWSVWLVFCDCGFHSVCPLMDKDKRLIKASWWERLTVGDTVLMGGVMLIKSSIQFSSDWQDCVSSLLFHLRHTMMEVMKIIAFLKKSYDQPTEHIKKQRRYFSKKRSSNQSYGFSSSHVWIWELDCKESWALKNDAFEIWCWRRLLRVPWTARRSNQSIIKEINPEYSLEGLMLKLKLQYFGHWMQRTDSFEKILMLGKSEDRRRRGRLWMRWLDVIIDLTDMFLSNSRSWWWTGKPGMLHSMESQRVRYDWATELTDPVELKCPFAFILLKQFQISCYSQYNIINCDI